ncbi:hypothetical protein ACFL1Q_01765 [Patescibacteria group bacterium]
MFSPKSVLAFCPVCTVAVAAGLGLSRWIGIDDTVSGVWIGGLTLSSSLWFANWLRSKYGLCAKTKHLNWMISGFFYLLVFIPLYYSGILGHPFNTLWGMDKLVVGTIFGSLVFLLSFWLDRKIREIHKKQLFNFQKVIIPVALLLLTSAVLFIITSVKIGIR